MNFCQFPEFLPFEEDFSLFTNAQYSYDSQFADIQPTFWEQQLNPSTTTENDYYRLIGVNRGYEAPYIDTYTPYPPTDIQDWSYSGLPERKEMRKTGNTNEVGRRNLSKLLKSEYKFKPSKYLIFFTYSALNDPHNTDIIWRDESEGKFFFRNPERFAHAWGKYKGKRRMNYSKVARSLRYYYKDGLLSKSEGLREYVWDPSVLHALRQKFNINRRMMCSSSSD